MSGAAAATADVAGSRVVVGNLRRVQRGHGYAFVAHAQAPQPVPVRQPARVAVTLALANKIQQAIDRGTVRDRAEVARRLGITRARISQLLDLTLLAPDIQEVLLAMESVGGVEPLSEHLLREVSRCGAWAEQREVWNPLHRSA